MSAEPDYHLGYMRGRRRQFELDMDGLDRLPYYFYAFLIALFLTMTMRHIPGPVFDFKASENSVSIVIGWP